MKSRTDIDEPMLLQEKMENAEPSRAMLLRESVDPKETQSNTDNCEPTLARPKTEKEEPRVPKLLSDNVLPKCT